MEQIEKIEKFLNQHYDFQRNVIKERVEFKEKRKTRKQFKLMGDYNFYSIRRKLRMAKLNISMAELHSLFGSDFVKKYNPIEDYFNQLPTWDEVDHIELMANKIRSNNQEFLQWSFKKWIVGMVACGLSERITNQQVFIISGPQGCGKTTWIENLMPTKMRDYLYSGKINPSSKDSTLLLAERLLVNMDELASLNHKNVEDFKELITKTKISERRVYGKFTDDYSRIASFAASSNHTDILTDTSGNRRFLTNKTDVDIDCTVYENLDQFYAQALHLYKSDFKFFFDSEDIVEIEKQNTNFRKFSSLEILINEHIIGVEENDSNLEVITMASIEIIEQLKVRAKNCPLIYSNQMGKAMTSLKHKKVKHEGVYKYEFCFREHGR